MRTRTIISLLTVAAALGCAGTGWAASRDGHGGDRATRRDSAGLRHLNRDVWRQTVGEIHGRHLVGPVEAQRGRADRGWQRGYPGGGWEHGHRRGAAMDSWRLDDRRHDDRGRCDRRHDQRGPSRHRH